MAQSPFFSASCLATGGTRCNGTVPLNQNLIQSRRRSFTVPGRLVRPHPRMRRAFCGCGAFRSSDH
jgi:hypothetical protein